MKTREGQHRFILQKGKQEDVFEGERSLGWYAEMFLQNGVSTGKQSTTSRNSQAGFYLENNKYILVMTRGVVSTQHNHVGRAIYFIDTEKISCHYLALIN